MVVLGGNQYEMIDSLEQILCRVFVLKLFSYYVLLDHWNLHINDNLIMVLGDGKLDSVVRVISENKK